MPGIVHKIVAVSQYILSILLIGIIIQIFLQSGFNTNILLSIAIISDGVSSVTLGLLAIHFLDGLDLEGRIPSYFMEYHRRYSS